MDRGNLLKNAGSQHNSTAEELEKRLYIGNLSKTLSEFKLLKLVKPFGKIKKFDFMWHRMGMQMGRPRGYAFVQFATRQDAKCARDSLAGKVIEGKALTVRFCRAEVGADNEYLRISTLNPEEGNADGVLGKESVIDEVAAIREKLAELRRARGGKSYRASTVLKRKKDEDEVEHSKKPKLSRGCLKQRWLEKQAKARLGIQKSD